MITLPIEALTILEYPLARNVLNLPADWTDAQLRKAHRTQARHWHPDSRIARQGVPPRIIMKANLAIQGSYAYLNDELGEPGDFRPLFGGLQELFDGTSLACNWTWWNWFANKGQEIRFNNGTITERKAARLRNKMWQFYEMLVSESTLAQRESRRLTQLYHRINYCPWWNLLCAYRRLLRSSQDPFDGYNHYEVCTHPLYHHSISCVAVDERCRH